MRTIRHCQICGAREASTSVAFWQGGIEFSRTFVCNSCADREEKLLGRGWSVSLVKLAELVAERQARRAGSDPDKECPLCGASLPDLVADGLLGCGYCYQRFKQDVASSIRIAQGNLQHRGKSPIE